MDCYIVNKFCTLKIDVVSLLGFDQASVLCNRHSVYWVADTVLSYVCYFSGKMTLVINFRANKWMRRRLKSCAVRNKLFSYMRKPAFNTVDSLSIGCFNVVFPRCESVL